MSGLDIFAWIVLIILVASVIGVFCIAGWLPGHIAKTRGHPWAQAVTVAGWVTLICGFALWPIALIWAYVDVPAAHGDGATVMMVAMMAVYLVLLFVLVHFGIVRFNLFWKSSPFIVLLLLNLGAVHSDGMGRAAGACAGGAQFGRDRAGRRRRGDRGSGRGAMRRSRRATCCSGSIRCRTRRRSRRSRRN